MRARLPRHGRQRPPARPRPAVSARALPALPAGHVLRRDRGGGGPDRPRRAGPRGLAGRGTRRPQGPLDPPLERQPLRRAGEGVCAAPSTCTIRPSAHAPMPARTWSATSRCRARIRAADRLQGGQGLAQVALLERLSLLPGHRAHGRADRGHVAGRDPVRPGDADLPADGDRHGHPAIRSRPADRRHHRPAAVHRLRGRVPLAARPDHAARGDDVRDPFHPQHHRPRHAAAGVVLRDAPSRRFRHAG